MKPRLCSIVIAVALATTCMIAIGALGGGQGGIDPITTMAKKSVTKADRTILPPK